MGVGGSGHRWHESEADLNNSLVIQRVVSARGENEFADDSYSGMLSPLCFDVVSMRGLMSWSRRCGV